jgi:predicted negative regulator of RcsB-dependent stress response
VHWQQVAKHQAFEPTGLLGLAKAQIHEKKWDAAKATVEKLNATEWPSRFSNLRNQVMNLESRLERMTHD